MHRLFLFFSLLILLTGCGVYSFTGANIEGKSLNMHVLDNRARNVVPTVSPTLTQKIRSRILSQTGLSPVNTDNADYDISGSITGYEVTVSAVQNTQQASKNRLTVTVNINFRNRKNPKNDFTQSFSAFEDFDATQTIQTVESQLLDKIGDLLADNIFNKAFVNW